MYRAFVILMLLLAFQITRADSKQFRGYLENAATMGRPLLVEDIDEPFGPTILRLASLVCIKRGKWQVKVGDKEVNVADGFRLYLTTKLARPLVSQETPAYINIVDFTLTEEAVTDQLLSCIFQNDKPVSGADSHSYWHSRLCFSQSDCLTVNKCRLIITVKLPLLAVQYYTLDFSLADQLLGYSR